MRDATKSATRLIESIRQSRAFEAEGIGVGEAMVHVRSPPEREKPVTETLSDVISQLERLSVIVQALSSLLVVETVADFPER